MKDRRNFLRTSAISISGAPLMSVPGFFFNELSNQPIIVKQSEECETFFVRENTPIMFNISKGTDNVSAVSLLTEELMPGSSIPVHKHLNEDEYFLFMGGTGLITIDDKTFPFKEGTTAFVPKNIWHGIKNTGSDKVSIFFGYSPAGFEGFFREIGTPKGQVFKQKPKEEFDSIAKKYGMVFK